MSQSLHSAFRHRPEFPIRPHPHLRVDLLARHDFALQEMAVQQVVVHRLADDLRDGRVLELDEGIVLGSPGLETCICIISSVERIHATRHAGAFYFTHGSVSRQP